MQTTSIEVRPSPQVLRRTAGASWRVVRGRRSRDGGHVAVLGVDPARERERRRLLLGAQLQASELADRLRVGEALRLADRRWSMFSLAAALYVMRRAQARLGCVADVRLILGTKWLR
jgi:hypothetical protein